MTPEYTNQLAAELLLSSFLSVLALGLLATGFIMVYLRRRLSVGADLPPSVLQAPRLAGRYQSSVFDGACRWVAVKSSDVNAVQAALGLHNPVLCSWGEGLASLSVRKLFVSPPIRSWILVVGPGLPDPNEDIDRCFHFVRNLSRTLGEIHFYSAHRVLNHHAWVRAERGRIRRAYAWAGETLWNQGARTPAEAALCLTCFDYGEAAPVPSPASDAGMHNAERVMALAGRWSFDPSTVNEAAVATGLGVAGDLARPRH